MLAVTLIDCVFSAGDIWICKPTGLNQGRGIFLIRDLEEFRSTYLEQDLPDIGRRPRHVADRIVQRFRTCFNVIFPLTSNTFEVTFLLLLSCEVLRSEYVSVCLWVCLCARKQPHVQTTRNCLYVLHLWPWLCLL